MAGGGGGHHHAKVGAVVANMISAPGLHHNRHKTEQSVERRNQLRTNWAETLSGRARCDFYMQEDLAHPPAAVPGHAAAASRGAGAAVRASVLRPADDSFPTENAMPTHNGREQ